MAVAISKAIVAVLDDRYLSPIALDEHVDVLAAAAYASSTAGTLCFVDVVDEGLNPTAAPLHLDGQELVFTCDPIPTRSDDGLQLDAIKLASAIFDYGGSAWRANLG